MSKVSWSSLTSLFVKEDAAPPEPSLAEPEPEPEPEVLVDESGSPAITEGRPFEDIYSANGVGASAYPVEKLLAFMGGLATMPPDQVRMVVAAMDAADTSWTIQDPVDDAVAKIEVLQSEKRRLTATAAQVEGQGKADAEALDTGLAATSTDIRQQIEALQVRLQEEITRVAAEKSAIETRSRAARDACTRETARLDAEVSRLNRVPTVFGGGK